METADGKPVDSHVVFGEVVGVHIDDRFIREETPFRERIAHGLLSAGFISACMGTRLPGPGTIYLSQSLKFTRPVRIGDTVTARVEVLEWNEGKRRARLATTCRNQRNEVVIEGEALVMVPDEEAGASR